MAYSCILRLTYLLFYSSIFICSRTMQCWTLATRNLPGRSCPGVKKLLEGSSRWMYLERRQCTGLAENQLQGSLENKTAHIILHPVTNLRYQFVRACFDMETASTHWIFRYLYWVYITYYLWSLGLHKSPIFNQLQPFQPKSLQQQPVDIEWGLAPSPRLVRNWQHMAWQPNMAWRSERRG